MKSNRKRRHLAAVNRGDWMSEVKRASMAYDWHVRDEAVFAGLVHPEDWRRWLEKGPCPGCPCQAWCDRICRLRAKWWDDSVARVRKQIGM